MDNNMKGEIEEMIDLYVEKGMSETDARVIINTMAKYPEAFLDNMMVVELHLVSAHTHGHRHAHSAVDSLWDAC